MLRVVHAAGRRRERGRARARCPPSSGPHLQRLSPMGPASPAQTLWASSAGLPHTAGPLPSNAAPSLQICSCPVLPIWLPSQTGTWCQVHSPAVPVRPPSSLPLLPSPLVPPAPKGPQEAKLLSLCSLQAPTTLWPHNPSDYKSDHDTLTKIQLWFHKVCSRIPQACHSFSRDNNAVILHLLRHRGVV